MHRERTVREGARIAQIMEKQLCCVRWRVKRVYCDSQDIEHAHLVNLDDPTTTKTIAVSELMDDRRFALIAEGVSELSRTPQLVLG